MILALALIPVVTVFFILDELDVEPPRGWWAAVFWAGMLTLLVCISRAC